MILLILVFAVVILFEAFELSVLKRHEYVTLSKEQMLRMREVKAIRGNILSFDGRLLATSLPKYEIRFDTRAHGISDALFAEHVDSLALLCSQHFTDKSHTAWLQYLKNARAKNERYLYIAQEVSFETAKAMLNWPLFRMGRYKGGLIREERNVREMPFGRMARRTIGFKTPNGNAVGLEAAYDSLLRGVSGKRLEQRISGNVWRPVGQTEFNPDNGCDIVTTLDVNIQDVAEDALRRALSQNNAQSGCAILMEVESGAIRAIANFSRLPNGQYFEDINLAIHIASDPGSTFKLASTMALMEEGVLNLDDSIDINYGTRQFYDKTMVDAHVSGSQKIPFREVFEYSSNVGIAGLVYDRFSKKPEKFIAYLSSLNLDRPLGIQIPEEGNIRIKRPTDKDWNMNTLPWTAIGYESRITALQTLTLYNAVANRGVMVKPYFVSEIRKTGKTLWTHKQEVLNAQIASDATIEKATQLLRGVVERGTARKLKNLDYEVAGKTGTVQILKGTRYDKGSHKASFVGFFPATQPKYTCIVVVNAPRGGEYTGAQIAGPVFREIADKVYAQRFDMHPAITATENAPLPYVKNGNRDDIKTLLDQLGISSRTYGNAAAPTWVTATRKEKSIRLNEKEHTLSTTPNTVGMGLRDALYLMEQCGYKVRVVGAGKVIHQSIMHGTQIKKGSTITLTLAL